MARAIPSKYLYVYVALAIALMATAWIVVNDNDYFNNSLIYFVFGSLAFMFYYTVHPIFKFVGITKKDFIQDLIPGIGFAIGFIFINYLSTAITLGIPTMVVALATSGGTFAVGGAIAISVFVAPIIEEIVFRGFGQKVFEYLFKNWIIAGIITSVLFSIFHWAAYGASFAMASPFIGAFIFGMSATWIVRKTDSLATSIIAHAIVNAFILRTFFLVIGG